MCWSAAYTRYKRLRYERQEMNVRWEAGLSTGGNIPGKADIKHNVVNGDYFADIAKSITTKLGLMWMQNLAITCGS